MTDDFARKALNNLEDKEFLIDSIVKILSTMNLKNVKMIYYTCLGYKSRLESGGQSIEKN